MANRRAAPRRRDPTRHTRANPVNSTDATTVSTCLRTRAPVLFRARRRRPQPPARLEHLINILGPAFTQFLPPQSLVALRGTSSVIRRDTHMRCMNHPFPGWVAGPFGRYNRDMPNPDPWADSIRIPGPRGFCRQSNRMLLMRPCEGPRYMPSITTQQNPNLDHDDQFILCKPCADEAYRQLDHTRQPPWYIALCRPCSRSWRYNRTNIYGNFNCTCHTDWEPANSNLCNDCRFRFREKTNTVMARSCRFYVRNFPRNPTIRGVDNLQRWVRHGHFNRNNCQCGRNWQQVRRTYPLVNGVGPRPRDLTQMACICLRCDNLVPPNVRP